MACPRSRSMAATVELSTPPLMATATVLALARMGARFQVRVG